MKTKVYLRVAKANRSGSQIKVVAGKKMDQRPLTAVRNTRDQVLPTVCFAIELDIPDAAFVSAAQVVATLKVPEDQLVIAAEVVAPE